VPFLGIVRPPSKLAADVAFARASGSLLIVPPVCRTVDRTVPRVLEEDFGRRHLDVKIRFVADAPPSRTPRSALRTIISAFF